MSIPWVRKGLARSGSSAPPPRLPTPSITRRASASATCRSPWISCCRETAAGEELVQHVSWQTGRASIRSWSEPGQCSVDSGGGAAPLSRSDTDRRGPHDQRGGSSQRSACLEQHGLPPDPTKMVVHTAKEERRAPCGSQSSSRRERALARSR